MTDGKTKEIERMIFERFGIRYLRAGNGEAEAELALRPEDLNAMGLPFGGILFNLADCTAGAAHRSMGCIGMTVCAESRFMRGVRGAEKLVCRAAIRKEGRSMGFVDASVADETGTELAAFTFTFVNYRGSL